MPRLVTISRFLISAVFVLCGALGASAQDRRQNAPGEFDFYVLSLSWSPSFCEAAGERAYFEAIRKARAAVKIPEEFLQLTEPKTIAPDELETAFIKANPGLSNSAISVTCDSKRLSEVRICLSKDLQFRSCEEIDRRACRRDEVLMPPVRGG